MSGIRQHQQQSETHIANQGFRLASYDCIAPCAKERKMVAVTLMGEHTHDCSNGTKVHVWKRSNKFLARGSYGGARFGINLGSDPSTAVVKLRQLLVDIDDGRFQRSSEKKKHRFPRVDARRKTLRDIINIFIAEKRQTRGSATADKYSSRLFPVLNYADQKIIAKKYPSVQDIDRQWALDLREFLHQAITTRNGHPNTTPKPYSQKQIRNVLETVRNLFCWAQSPQVRQLPIEWINPATTEFIGPKNHKDPLRRDPIPLSTRISLISNMDLWELSQLTFSILLPMRAEEVTGLLISEVDFAAKHFVIGTRFDGADFTKGKTSFVLPFPEELIPLLRFRIGTRSEGPLLLQAKHQRKNPQLVPENIATLEREYKALLSQQPPKSIACDNDRKQLFRKFLHRSCGGLNPSQLNKSFKAVCNRIGLQGVSIGTLRSSVTTTMKQAGISHLEHRYLTSHTTSDILNEYVSLDPHGEMQKYFALIRPLLNAITEQSKKFGIEASTTSLESLRNN